MSHLKLQTNILPTYQNFSQPFWQERTFKNVTNIVFIMKISSCCYKNYGARISKWCMFKELNTSTAMWLFSHKTTCYFEQLLRIHRLVQHPETPFIFQDLWGSPMHSVGKKPFVCLFIALVSKKMIFLFCELSFQILEKTVKTYCKIKSHHLPLPPSSFSQIYWGGIHDL